MKDSRRVTFVLGAHWFAGPTVALRRICEALPQLGWSPHLVLTGGRDKKAIDPRTWPNPVTRVGPFYSYGRMGRETAAAIRASAPEVVVGSYDFASVLAMQVLYRAGGCDLRLLQMLHADIDDEFARLAGIAPLVTAACGISNFVVREIERRVPLLQDRVFRWYCPVPCPEQAPARGRATGPLRMIYSGRVAQKEKRVLDLAEVAHKLLARGVDFHLTVAGDGPETPELRARLRQAGAENKCSFAGWVDSARLQELLAEQDVFLLTSSVESMGLALLEAMAHGVVPVVTDLPGPGEIVTAESGIRVPVGDAEAFAEALARIAGSRVPLDDMRLECWQTVRANYTIAAAVSSYAALLDATSRLPLPPWQRLRRLVYPRRLMDRIGVPQSIQDFKRRTLGQELWP